MRYRLRTLIILIAILPPILAIGWWATKTVTDTAVFVVVLGVAIAIPLLFRAVKERHA